MTLHKCTECKYEAKYKSEIKKHLWRTHGIGEGKVSYCSECEYSSRRSGCLKKHLWEVHQIGEGIVHQCPHCEYFGKRKAHLNAHLWCVHSIGSGEIHSCSDCKYYTKDKGSLIKHLWYVHDIGSGEIYSCPECKYSTKDKGNLIRHQSICTGESKLNHPETLVKNAIEYFNLEWIDQKTFKDCRHKLPLKFDFYLPQLDCLIEFDGPTHYKPIYGEKTFFNIKLRDKIKNTYAKKNQIPLLRIPYWEQDNIFELVHEFISSIIFN